MSEKIKKYQQSLVAVLITVCLGIILVGGVNYVGKLRQDLRNTAIQNLMTVTIQQQQAFDAFLEKDWAGLHGFVEFFTGNGVTRPEDIRSLLSITNEENAIYLAMCLDEGWICGTSFDDVRQLDAENLGIYRALEGSGVREPYTGLYSGTPRFGYYETFTFANGHRGMVQKSYDRSKVTESISLSFYNNQGFSHIVNQQGDILLRPESMSGNVYDNIFDVLAASHGAQEDAERLRAAMQSGASGSMAFSGEAGEFVYTYVPLENVDGWYLISLVPAQAVDSDTSQVLREFQKALGLLFLFLFICGILILITWRTQKNLLAKSRAVEYQTQLFDTFTSYLSGNTDDIYIILNVETDETDYISPNVTRVLGLQPQEVLRALYQQDMAAGTEAARDYNREIKSLTPGQVTKPRRTERVNPKTGERRYFLESAYCTLIQGEARCVIYISDRTKERKSQDDLAEALRMAQAANEAKSAFLSNISHDIRTPMNAIIGFLALMRDEVTNPSMVMEYTQRIDAASQHLLGLINDVLDMNKIESGSATLNISEMNLAEVIDEINTIIRPQTKAKNQTFDISVSHLHYEHLLGDKLRVNQILINLLSNAVKYTAENGTIQMRVEELPQVVDNYSRIRFTVSDNGLGMSPDYLKVIFDPFTREETKVTHEIQGTGLGMAITKSLVDLMGGTIHVESELGKGSTFTVELELCIQELEEDPKFWDKHRVTRMLVADDEEEVCRNIVKAMARVGVSADYVTDGETAVQTLRESREAGHPYDLILLDWKMPGLSGLETARLIRKNYSEEIPILLLTAYDWSDIEQEAIEIGVNHFMPKPFFMSSFKEAIRRLMGSQKPGHSGKSDVLRGRHILVVDDIEVNRIILVKILEGQGAACDTAGDGREAVEKFEASKPGEYDLILMDVQMPEMDGYTATRTIRGGGHPSAREIPIVAMTANAFVDDVRDAIESGMDAHIAKPVQIDKLKATIQEVLNQA